MQFIKFNDIVKKRLIIPSKENPEKITINGMICVIINTNVIRNNNLVVLLTEVS